MTKLEAMKEAARRDGDSPDDIEIGFALMIELGGESAFRANEELLPGTEEKFIEDQLAAKRHAKKIQESNPELAKLRALKVARQLIQEKQAKN